MERQWNADYIEAPVGCFDSALYYFRGWKENSDGSISKDLVLVAETDGNGEGGVLNVYESGHDEMVKEFADYYEINEIHNLF